MISDTELLQNMINKKLGVSLYEDIPVSSYNEVSLYEDFQVPVEVPVYEDFPVSSYNEVPVYAPVYEDIPVPVDVPVYEDIPVPVDVPVYEDIPVPVDVPVYEDIPVPVDVPVEVSLSLNDTVFNNREFVICDWNINRGDFVDTSMNQDMRRSKRKLLTELYCPMTIYNFLLSMLIEAIEREVEIDDEYKYYIFSPYNKKIGYPLDDFSCAGLCLKTKLGIKEANFIMSIYYILYTGLDKITSDETIFESLYRECVLLQDSNFELSLYYQGIVNENLNKMEMLTSVMSECFDLKCFPDKALQFNIWLLTYNNTVELVDEDRTAMTLFDLVEFYTNERLIDNKE